MFSVENKRQSILLPYAFEVEKGKITKFEKLKSEVNLPDELHTSSQLSYPTVHPAKKSRLGFELCISYTTCEIIASDGRAHVNRDIPVDGGELHTSVLLWVGTIKRDPQKGYLLDIREKETEQRSIANL